MAGKKNKPKKKLSAYNRHIQSEMKKGKSMKQAAASWRGQRKTKAAKKKSSPTKSGGKSRMGKRGFNTQKIYSIMRIAALALPAAGIAMSQDDTATKLVKAQRAYFGWDPNKRIWSPSLMLEGWGPAIGATVVTALVPKLGSMIRKIVG